MSSEEKTTPCTVRDILSAMDDCVPAGAMPVMHAASKEDNDKEGAHYRSVMNLTPAMASQWCAFYAVLADVPPSTVASESTTPRAAAHSRYGDARGPHGRNHVEDEGVRLGEGRICDGIGEQSAHQGAHADDRHA